ncbi:MAG: hypothetical protein L0Y74_05690, partial [candidate division Zixibacteria bacterium]|nr:hypothetical protein [candidate division Zixibacteria bacterium]
ASCIVLEHALRETTEQIKGAIVAATKTAFLQLMNSQINILIGGANGEGALFITNWENFLVRDPLQRADLYVNDFLTYSTSGKHLTQNYAPVIERSRPAAGSLSGSKRVAGESVSQAEGENSFADDPNDWATPRNELPVKYERNYANYLVEQAKSDLYDGECLYTFDEYGSSPHETFAEGDWASLNGYTQPCNNKFSMELAAEKVSGIKVAQENQKALAQSIAYGGYKAKTDEATGQVTTPGSTIKDVIQGVQDLGNKVVAAAQNPAQLLASMVTAAGNIAVQTIQNGILQVGASVEGEMAQVGAQVGGYTNQVFNRYGPGAIFNNPQFRTTAPLQTSGQYLSNRIQSSLPNQILNQPKLPLPDNN